MAKQKKRKNRRRVRFSLRALLVMVAVVGIAAAPYVNRLHKRQRAIARIETLGGSITGTGTAVSLKDTKAVDDDLIHLRHLRNVTALNLAGTRISNRGLRSLRTLPNIWIVSLRGTQVTDDGLRDLAVLSKLRELDLDDTKIMGQGLQHLRSLPELHTLRLQGTLIDDGGLPQLQHLPALRRVMLAGTTITDAGLEHLKALNGLEVIFLDDTGSGIPRDVPAGVTDEGVACLQQCLPNCKIWCNRAARRIVSNDGKETAARGSLVPANTLFSAPGRYMSPAGGLAVEITRESPGQVRYSSSGGMGGMGPGYSLSERDLTMCWDTKGRLWTYHPIQFVHYHHLRTDGGVTMVFVGSGVDYRDEMPDAFRENLPDDIERMEAEATAASADGVLTIPVTEPEDARRKTTSGSCDCSWTQARTPTTSSFDSRSPLGRPGRDTWRFSLSRMTTEEGRSRAIRVFLGPAYCCSGTAGRC